MKFDHVLGSTKSEHEDDIGWMREAARATILGPTTMEYPKKPKVRKHYTAED